MSVKTASGFRTTYPIEIDKPVYKNSQYIPFIGIPPRPTEDEALDNAVVGDNLIVPYPDNEIASICCFFLRKYANASANIYHFTFESDTEDSIENESILKRQLRNAKQQQKRQRRKERSLEWIQNRERKKKEQEEREKIYRAESLQRELNYLRDGIVRAFGAARDADDLATRINRVWDSWIDIIQGNSGEPITYVDIDTPNGVVRCEKLPDGKFSIYMRDKVA